VHLWTAQDVVEEEVLRPSNVIPNQLGGIRVAPERCMDLHDPSKQSDQRMIATIQSCPITQEYSIIGYLIILTTLLVDLWISDYDE
jgi:hypothetical protein